MSGPFRVTHATNFPYGVTHGPRLTTVGQDPTDGTWHIDYAWNLGFELDGLDIGTVVTGPNGIVVEVIEQGHLWRAPINDDGYRPNAMFGNQLVVLAPWGFDSNGNLMGPADYERKWKGQLPW